MKYQITYDNGNKGVIEGVSRVDYDGDYVVFLDKKFQVIRGVAKRNLLSFTRIDEPEVANNHA